MDVAAAPVSALKGVGPKLAERLARLNLRTVQDILFHLPNRYEDRTRLTPIGSLRPGREALIAGTVELADVVYRRRRSLMVRLADGTGHLHLRFFHFNAAQQRNLARGTRLRVFGEVRFGPGGFEMAHPEYQRLEGDTPAQAEERLTPVYPTTEGLYVPALRKLAQQALERWLEQIPEWLPEEVLHELKFPTLREALAYVHFPPPKADVAALLAGKHPTQARLAFEELLAHQLRLRSRRAQFAASAAPALVGDATLSAQLRTRLPYTLTRAQERVLAEILADVKHPHPMQRLIQGDVGSGKTVVAAFAALTAIEAGYQTAVMAPTELLAQQHLRSFSDWLAPLGVDVIGFSGKLKGGARKQVIESLSRDKSAVVVGTHALFQDDVEFAKLGLIVVDEQHRFGVHQRLQLRDKGSRGTRRPHQLTMTATPIPRTLAQSLYADLDVSVIDELPPGRKPVETVAVPATRRAEVVERIHTACRGGRQAYWVCPAIEESEDLELQAATDTAEALQEALPGVRIALVHGRMKPADKDAAMAAFLAGQTQLLVATTVIEVGVDVPNATLMIVENAERLGLAQLHQVRGRVGRGAGASVCVLLYEAPLSDFARERLATLRDSNDGFAIARKDLEMRGPGELLGTRQAGMPRFRIADVLRDAALLPRVQATADLLLQRHIDAVDPIVRRWLGVHEGYGTV
ncbi:MAG TPA: ATP-dependent DNA helicase RecG [Burkholderiales bacterium]|nr:ATP-dependent DNA helicase RecG [Burkholderiales bacterium]